MFITNNPINQEIFKNFESIRSYRSNIYCDSKDTCQIKENKKVNLTVLGATALGTLVSMLIIRKYKGLTLDKGIKICRSNDFKTNITALKNIVVKFLDIKAGLKEMLVLGAGSILGGLAGGIITDKDKNKHTKNKVKEAVYQFLNVSIPAILVDGLLEFTAKHKKLNNIPAKTAATIIGIGAGMPISALISNKINNSVLDHSKNKEDKYKRYIKPKDGIVHVDDIVNAINLAYPKVASKLCIDKILPFLYLSGGYEAGKAE